MTKRSILPAVLLLCLFPAAAQTPGRIHRTEVIPYDTRHDAEKGDRASSGHTIDFAPAPTGDSGAALLYEQQVEIPYVWTDGEVCLHLENLPQPAPKAACRLWVNGRQVGGAITDFATPAEFLITPCIRQGVNEFTIMLTSEDHPFPASRPERAAAPEQTCAAFAGSYLYYQEKRSVRDFEIALVPDTLGRDFAMLDLGIIVQNRFNYDEPVAVGYDIYSPEGKLLDFNITETTVPGRSADTLRFTPFIYHAFDYKWEAAGKNPPLYRVMLFTRRDGAYREYMPFRIGFGRTEFVDGKFMRFGREIRIKPAVFNVTTTDRRAVLDRIKALRAQGYNTLTPDTPQPAWFYALCDEAGLYVIDRAAIHAPEKRDDRRVGGTPSNDPSLADEYLARVQAMYYRSRNHTCVIAYALGGPSGNGYNLYKAYQWLKSVERNRPVFCEDADGEWNSDL